MKKIGLSTAVFFICLILVGELSGQERESYRSSNSELNRIKQLVDSAPLKSLDQLELYLKKNFKSMTAEEERMIYILIGRANLNLNQYDLALENLTRSTRSKRKITNRGITETPEVSYYTGLAHFGKGDWAKSESYLKQYLENTKPPNSRLRCTALLRLGRSQLNLVKYDEANESAVQAKTLSTTLGDRDLRLESILLLGDVQKALKEYDQAIVNYSQGLQISDSTIYDEKSQQITKEIGNTYKLKNDPKGELEFKKNERSRSVSRNDISTQNILDLDIAETYIEMDSSEQAVPYLKESVDLSEQLGDLTSNIQARKSLSDVYAESGNYNAALQNYKSYVSLVDQLYDSKLKEIELGTALQQDFLRKQETINLLEKDRQLSESQIALLQLDRELGIESMARQRLLIFGLILLILIVSISAIILFRNIQKKKLANQLLALKSLRSQMNPHFIFNALNSVNNFISNSDNRNANKYLSEFSRLMRTVMENSQKDFVPLSEEIEVLKLYLRLEHLRFQDKFDYKFSIDDSLEIEDFNIPPMLLQPYIENSIWHGLRYMETKGELRVSITDVGLNVVARVEDNGIGRKKSEELKTSNQLSRNSTGMKNTEDRISLLNQTYSTKIAVDIVDGYNGGPNGTTVTIVIPKTAIQETI